MPRVKYRDIAMRAPRLKVVEAANAIIAEYAAQGFTLTLRQLYYQFVSRGLIPNRDTEYNKLGETVNDARLAGLMDWLAIIDRTRNVQSPQSWETPEDIIHAAANSYRLDPWLDQAVRIEVWIEKDALVGVIEGVCAELRVPYFSCRGYTSQSEMWSAAMRLARHRRGGQEPIIFHLGDHDPSGIDMSRDIEERLGLFMGRPPEFHRLALNMDQVQQYDPPPNPAKLTDSRVGPYIEQYGNESWELDALEPAVMAQLIRDAVTGQTSASAWAESIAKENTERARLASLANRYTEALKALGLDAVTTARDECADCNDWRASHDGPNGECMIGHDEDGDSAFACDCTGFVEPEEDDRE